MHSHEGWDLRNLQKPSFLFFPLFISYTVGDSFYSGKLYSSDTYTVHHIVTIPGCASVKSLPGFTLTRRGVQRIQI